MGCLLYNLNRVFCREAEHLLDHLDPASVGLVLLDPPADYGIDDHGAAFDEQTGALVNIALGAQRVLRPGGAAVFIGEPRTVLAWEHACTIVGLRHMADMAVLWSKLDRGRVDGLPKRKGAGRRDSVLPSLFTHVKWHIRTGYRHTFNPKLQVCATSNVIVCRPVPFKDRLVPVQRPVEMYNYLISLLSESDDVVVDPFVGSGSSVIAALMAERYFIAGDHDQAMCGVTRRRLRNWRNEPLQRVQLWVRGALVEIEG